MVPGDLIKSRCFTSLYTVPGGSAVQCFVPNGTTGMLISIRNDVWVQWLVRNDPNQAELPGGILIGWTRTKFVEEL